MRKTTTFFNCSILFSFFLLVFFKDVCFGMKNHTNHVNSPTNKNDSRMIDANQVAMYITNNGTVARDPERQAAGGYYPNGSDKTIIYVSGLFIAGKVDGEIRTACSSFNVEYQPGIILPDGTPDDPTSEKYRVYKIKPGDSADPASPNYNRDYAEWPIDDGAPVDNNGLPLVIGDQTLWYVMNDGNQVLHNGFYNTRPLNLEVRCLAWAFDDDVTPLGKTIFLHYTIINKNSAPIEDAYVGIFADMDVGDALDDESACDTTLNLSYGYNGKNVDKIYGAATPACGVCLLQGPAVPSDGDIAFQFIRQPIPNAKILAITSNIARFFDTWLPIEDTAQRLYNNFQGLYNSGNPIVDPTTGKASPFMHSGDPLINLGWVYNSPHDIYFIQGSGPFSMAPLDTQRVVYSIIVGQGETRLESVLDLKRNANIVRDAFLSEFNIKAVAETEVNFPSQTEAEVLVTARMTSELGITSVHAELFQYNNSMTHAIQLYDDGHHHDGSANDGFFANVWHTAPHDSALYMNLKIIDAASDEHLFARVVEKITLTPNKIMIPTFNVVADHINNDDKPNPGENVRLGFSVTNNCLYDLGRLSVLLNSDDPYIQREPQYFFFSEIPAGQTKQLIYDLDDEKTYYSINIASDAPDTHTIYFDVTFFDNLNHVWHEKRFLSLKVEPLAYIPNQIIPSHVAGKSDASFVISVIDPSALTGHSYELTISRTIYYEERFNLIDETLGDTLLKNQEAPDEYAYNVPITDGFKVIKVHFSRDRVIGIFENIEGGHSTPFSSWSVASDGTMDESLFIFGPAFNDKSIQVELEFTNDIDSSGVIGIPSGQGAFSYVWFPINGPQSFLPSTINAWKIHQGQRVSRLNVCFKDMPPNFDEICSFGDRVYIMSSNYDSTGQYYFNSAIDENQELLCEVRLTINLATDSSVIDAGDKITISREFRATSEDRWVFIPANVKKPSRQIQESFTLHQNYPNPFNSNTIIKFQIDQLGKTNLIIYNLLGQQVCKLLDKNLQPGEYRFQWDGKNDSGQILSSGLYFVRLVSGGRSELIKLVLVR